MIILCPCISARTVYPTDCLLATNQNLSYYVIYAPLGEDYFCSSPSKREDMHIFFVIEVEPLMSEYNPPPPQHHSPFFPLMKFFLWNFCTKKNFLFCVSSLRKNINEVLAESSASVKMLSNKKGKLKKIESHPFNIF